MREKKHFQIFKSTNLQIKKKVKHRLISKPIFFEKEVALINGLFNLGLPCFHLRKPEATLEECQFLLEQIDASFYSRIIVHQHPSLVAAFGLLGWHLREGERQKMTELDLSELIKNYHGNNYLVGTAIHQSKALNHLPVDLDYAMVSPIFSSISKQNYQPTEDWNIHDISFSFELVALGGIGEQTLLLAHEKGFKEVAYLGAVWADLDNVLDNYKLLCKEMKRIDLMG